MEKISQKERPKRSKIRKYRAKLDVVCLIRQGYTRDDIIARLIEDYDYAEISAQNLYYEALKESVRTIEDYIKEASKSNVQRLLGIIDQCYNDKRYGDAMKGIDILNKMGGLYAPEEHTVNTNTEPIKITFE